MKLMVVVAIVVAVVGGAVVRGILTDKNVQGRRQQQDLKMTC
jgi:hypothetical protein